MKKILVIIAAVVLTFRGYSQSIKPTHFKWTEFATVDTTFEKAAILIPLYLEGVDKKYFMQLDLGSDATMFYGIPFEQISKKYPSLKKDIKTISKYNREVEVVPVNGRLGNYLLRSDMFYIKQDYGDSLNTENELNVIGTVGLDFFCNRVVMLDFVNQKFAIADTITELDKSHLRNTDTIAIKLIFNKIFVSGIKTGDKPLDNIIYDTGSSIFSLVVTKEKWQKLTGKTGDEADNIILKIPAWQKEVKVIGAPLKENLFLGNLEVKHPVIFFGILEKLDLSKAPFKLEGLIGNVLFLNSIIIIDFKNKIMLIKR